MKSSNEGSAFQIGLAINDLLSLEGFPEVHPEEKEGIIFRRELGVIEFTLCYGLAYRIWESLQRENENKGF
jgi:hypothetical protein